MRGWETKTVGFLAHNGTVLITNNKLPPFQASERCSAKYRKWDSSLQSLTNDQNFSVAKIKPSYPTLRLEQNCSILFLV